jgi:hypothetical protein
MSYKPLEIETIEIAGITPSLLAIRLPKRSKEDSEFEVMATLEDGRFLSGVDFILGKNDSKLAGNLIRAGNDHAKAMRGIIVWAKLKMQVGWMIEFETYRHGVECLSTSSAMHGELKHLTGPELAEQKQADLPEKVYTRIVHMSYQALRSMYYPRRHHRHPDWPIFCKWIESLPYANELIIAAKPERKNKDLPPCDACGKQIPDGDNVGIECNLHRGCAVVEGGNHE